MRKSYGFFAVALATVMLSKVLKSKEEPTEPKAIHFLAGASLHHILGLFWRFGIDTSSKAYGGMGEVLTVSTLASTPFGLVQHLLYGAAVERQEVNPEPVFIVGGFRSGSTNLHMLMAEDKQFAWPTVFDASSPNHFLLTRSWLPGILEGSVPDHRFDGVGISLLTPQEDDFAQVALNQQSYYLTFSFPKNHSHFSRFLTCQRCTETEKRSWKKNQHWFMKALSYANSGKPLLLKSPSHSGKIDMILSLFPKARFVHIHRHPHDTFRSILRLAIENHNKHNWPYQDFEPETVISVDKHLADYKDLYDAFLDQRASIPEGQLIEMSFDEVSRDPVGTMKRTYQELGLAGWEGARPAFEAYAAKTMSNYKRHRYSRIDDAMAKEVDLAMARFMKEYGYK